MLNSRVGTAEYPERSIFREKFEHFYKGLQDISARRLYYVRATKPTPI